MILVPKQYLSYSGEDIPMVSRKKKHVELNTPAPDVVFEDFKGNNFRLSDYLEKMNVLLIFNRGFT